MPKILESPSDRQLEILAYIVRHVENYGYQPCLSEIGTAFGVTKASIHHHIKQLHAFGLVEMSGEAERAIRLRYSRFNAERKWS